MTEPFRIKAAIMAMAVNAAEERMRAHHREFLDHAMAGDECVCEACDQVMVPLLSWGPELLSDGDDEVQMVLCRNCGHQILKQHHLLMLRRANRGGDWWKRGAE